MSEQDRRNNRNKNNTSGPRLNAGGGNRQRQMSREEVLKRRRRAELERKKRRRKVLILRSIIAVALLLIILIVVIITNSVKNRVYVDINTTTQVQGGDFANISFINCEITGGAEEVNYAKAGEYPVTVKSLGISHTSYIVVEDKNPPKGEGVDVEQAVNSELHPSDFVTNVSDESNVTAKFKDKPDATKEGIQTVTIILTDESGNITEVTCNLTLYADHEAPVISGVKDIEAFIGDSVSYKEGVTVTDNMDENPLLEIDNSQVNLDAEGEYVIVYTATDAAGNQSTAEARLIITEKPVGYVEPDVVMSMANEILDQIITDDMNQAEAAEAIYKWMRANIGYSQSVYKESWTGGAYIGFTERSGDCYIFFSTAKALLTAAGIENIDVVKQDTSHSRHYWSMINVGTGWYHYDTTNFASGAVFFMLTDAELDEYSAAHNASHNRDMSLYPATPDAAFDIESPDILPMGQTLEE